MTAAKKPEPEFPAESRTVTYLPAGVGVDPYQGVPTLDPELAKIRDAEIKRDAERAKADQPAPVKAAAPEPAKKAAPKKSSK